jgi:uncharacterized protein
MTGHAMSSTNVDHIPVIWTGADSPTQRPRLVIWLDGFTGNKERMTSYLAELAEKGFVALSFDAYQHGERASETVEALLSRIGGNYRHHFWPILGQTILDATRVIDWAISTLHVSSEVFIGGISMGGDVSVAAAGIDKRIRCVATMLATADWLRPGMKDHLDPTIDFIQGEPDAYANFFYKTFNPLTHLESYSHLPAISFECGAIDTLVPPDGALRFQKELIGKYGNGSKLLRVNLHENAGHDPDVPEMWNNCLDWFTTLERSLRD